MTSVPWTREKLTYLLFGLLVLLGLYSFLMHAQYPRKCRLRLYYHSSSGFSQDVILSSISCWSPLAQNYRTSHTNLRIWANVDMTTHSTRGCPWKRSLAWIALEGTEYVPIWVNSSEPKSRWIDSRIDVRMSGWRFCWRWHQDLFLRYAAHWLKRFV